MTYAKIQINYVPRGYGHTVSETIVINRDEDLSRRECIRLAHEKVDSDRIHETRILSYKIVE